MRRNDKAFFSLATLFALATLAGTAPAQMELTVNPDPLIKGGIAEVAIEGGTPNAVVVVDIDNGGQGADTLTIVLDSSGSGSKHWLVPNNWDLAKFNAGDQEVVRHIVEK